MISLNLDIENFSKIINKIGRNDIVLYDAREQVQSFRIIITRNLFPFFRKILFVKNFIIDIGNTH